MVTSIDFTGKIGGFSSMVLVCKNPFGNSTWLGISCFRKSSNELVDCQVPGLIDRLQGTNMYHQNRPTVGKYTLW